jgi:TPP-dependent indolepyruvate ferredoxin oxidoreductase alpha subunit
MKSRSAQVLLLLVLSVSLVACNTWPTIIATAEAISSITSVFYPAVGSLAALAVTLLQQAESAAQAYQKNKSGSTEAAYVAAIENIEKVLPADLQTLNVPPADRAKVTAAVNIILDYVEALGVQVPATAVMVMQNRVARQAGPPPKPLKKADIESRWKTQVCAGDARCTKLIKGPGFWESLGNSIGETKWGQ